MTVVRRLARPMLAAIFVADGLDALLHPAGPAKAAAPLVAKLSGPLNLPDDPELLVRANGAAMVSAGAFLAVGRFPRIAALTLACSLIPTTYNAHAFWAIKDPAVRSQQKIDFLKNVSLLGGVLLASVDTAGQPGLAYRARHIKSEAQRTAALTKRETKRAAKQATKQAQRLAKSALD
ncbi:MAG: putative oxidoreductase [Actinomycetota bacterium]|nr:putative oxidoreductase [Actinomycetota bacterium]